MKITQFLLHIAFIKLTRSSDTLLVYDILATRYLHCAGKKLKGQLCGHLGILVFRFVKKEDELSVLELPFNIELYNQRLKYEINIHLHLTHSITTRTCLMIIMYNFSCEETNQDIQVTM